MRLLMGGNFIDYLNGFTFCIAVASKKKLLVFWRGYMFCRINFFNQLDGYYF